MRRTDWFMFVLLILSAPLARAARQEPQGLPPDIWREVTERRLVPTGIYSPAKRWSAHGGEANHIVGNAEPDDQAADGTAWEVRVGRDTPGRHALYGPYAPMPEGDYVAFFRIKLIDEAGEEAVANLDASAATQSSPARQIVGAQLAVNRFVETPLAFHHPGGKLECRLFWTGYSSLHIDGVALFRFSGGSISTADDRAPAAVMSGKPNNLPFLAEPRPFPDPFPRSAAPAQRLRVFDPRRLPVDQQQMITSLQGLVNRRRPELYLIHTDRDPQWLEWMQKRGWIHTTETVTDADRLLRIYRDRVRGLVITDPSLPATKNIATMLAAVKSGLIVSPRMAKRMGLPILADLRGRWHTSVGAYQWAFDTLWPSLNHHVIACEYPDRVTLRDYLVANRIFTFWLSGPIDGARPFGNPTAEARLMERLLARMPANIPVMSYPWAGKEIGIGEGPGVKLFAEFGKYLVGSPGCSNLTVHSGFQVPSFHQRVPPVPPLRNDKTYVSWIISDGDNLPVLTDFNFPEFWKSDVRGKLPLGWTMSPSASILIPDIVDHYYRTATPNDCFVAAVSGIGYTYPDSYGARFNKIARPRVFDGFLDQTGAYMARLDMKTIWPMGISRPDLFRRYAERIPALRAIFPDYGRTVSSYSDATYPTARNVAVFHAITSWTEDAPREKQIDSLVTQIRAAVPSERPAFMHLFVLNWFADLPMLQEVSRRLGSGFVVVRPDHLASLYAKYLARQQVLTRIPEVAASIEGHPIAFTVECQNVSGRPIGVGISVARGLRSARIQPVRTELAPGQNVAFRISGVPSGDRIDLDASGPGGAKRMTVPVVQISSAEVSGPLPKRVHLEFAHRFAAIEMPHAGGSAEADEGAQSGHVWTARAGDTPAGFVLYGPYASMPPGRYLALFRVKKIGEGSGDVGTVDACTEGGQHLVGYRVVNSDDLATGAFRDIPLLFQHPGGPLETRIKWAGGVSIGIDSVYIWRVLPH